MTDDKNLLRLHSDVMPTDKEIYDFIGKAKKPWVEFVSFLEETYDFTPAMKYWGKKHGWIIQYRKSSRTWCALYPEKDSFTIQIIFGKKEVEKFEEKRNEFGDFVISKFDTTKQLHDGRWMFFKITDSSLIKDLKKMMLIKRRPKKKLE